MVSKRSVKHPRKSCINYFVLTHCKIFLSFGWEVCYNEHTPFNLLCRVIIVG